MVLAVRGLFAVGHFAVKKISVSVRLGQINLVRLGFFYFDGVKKNIKLMYIKFSVAYIMA